MKGFLTIAKACLKFSLNIFSFEFLLAKIIQYSMTPPTHSKSKHYKLIESFPRVPIVQQGGHCGLGNLMKTKKIKKNKNQ